MFFWKSINLHKNATLKFCTVNKWHLWNDTTLPPPPAAEIHKEVDINHLPVVRKLIMQPDTITFDYK